MNEGLQFYEIIFSVGAVITIFGSIAYFGWRVVSEDLFWERIREHVRAKKGWKRTGIERTTWVKAASRWGPVTLRVGQIRVGRGWNELEHPHAWVLDLEFDAPFPQDLVIEERTLAPGVAVDERLGGERSMFALAFQVHTRGRQPVSSPVMQPRLGELLLELQEASDGLVLERREIRLYCRQEGVKRERLKEIIDRCVEIGEEIADLAGLQHDEGEAVDAALEGAERAREVREREEARSTAGW